MNSLGRQLVVELKDCKSGQLNNIEFVKDIMLNAAKVAGAEIVGHSFHPFSPHGISGVELISESHLCIHTWPEYNYAAVDIFTCGDSIEPKEAVKPLIDRMGAGSSSFVELERGILHNNRLVVS